MTDERGGRTQAHERLRAFYREIAERSDWTHLKREGLALGRRFNEEELDGELPYEWLRSALSDSVELAKREGWAAPAVVEANRVAAEASRAAEARLNGATKRPPKTEEKPPAKKGRSAAPTDEEVAARGPLTATPFTKIEARSITWKEKPLWQDSAFELLCGVKGAGKGTYLAGLSGRETKTGKHVLFIATEDSAEIDMKPRLVAAGAVTERCHLVDQHVELPADLDALRRLAEGIGNVGLLVIDPVANHIPTVRSSNADAEVRLAISGLNKLADDLGCLLVGVRHFKKDRSGGALASVLGSTAWIDVPRAVVGIAADDEDEDVRHIQVIAGNRSKNGAGQMFRIDAVDVPGLTEPITLAVALGESEKDVDDLISAAAERRRPETKTGAARELILDVLEDEGEQESDAFDARVAAETGLAARTVRNARMRLIAEGLIKAMPEKDEFGAVERWKVHRTLAPRP